MGRDKNQLPTGFDNDEAIVFFGEKKSLKKKSNSFVDVASLAEAGVVCGVKDDEIKLEEQSVGSGKSKKKKKSGRKAEEEQDDDDLDKIIAELGEAMKPQVPPSEPVATTDEKEGEEEKEESAAAKKKKKKKEKEKAKKAAAAADVVKTAVEEPKKKDGKSKAPSKLVREIARQKEVEERMRKEEEERLRKEEEEQKRQEELERQAEETRCRKREKKLKKKQEGKLLTEKQKQDARRLEAMRNQILANASFPLPTGDNDGAPKKPVRYQTKKLKPVLYQANGAAPAEVEESPERKGKEPEQKETVVELNSMESESVDRRESLTAEEKIEIADALKGNRREEVEEEYDEEWDAKSWDDVNLNVKGAFDDEETDFPEPQAQKEIKSDVSALHNADVASSKAIPFQPVKSQDAKIKKSYPETEVKDKTRQAEVNLRSPICCIMGHVDTGKTKLLDCIRRTNVQEGEAGGITQQIGATYIPAESIRERTNDLKAIVKLKVPGLLVIDTPGHESFTNLRSRGSGVCDIAILVVDIMHGLEPQTIESLNLLKMRNTEFIVALNKVDKLCGWKTCQDAPIAKAIKQQSEDAEYYFNMRLQQIKTEFQEQGYNTELYYKNKKMEETVSIVPTSAKSGEGIADMLLLLAYWTQKTMVEKLTFRNEVQCIVLEVKVTEGHGTTIDVVLVNGVLRQGDQIVVCGLLEPIVTTIRTLLTPHPMKELRVKGEYMHPKEIKAAQGIKISAQGLENAIAGTSLYVVGPDDKLDDVKEAAKEDKKSVMSRIDISGEGVYVQASSLGSLEALLAHLKTVAVSIPVGGTSIGPVHKNDVLKASVNVEKKREYATILAFDVEVKQEVQKYADELGVKVFLADSIYHLSKPYKAYIDNLKEEKKREAAGEAVFPCVLKILPNSIFNKKDPILLGVEVLEGIAKVGTPICIPQRGFIDIGIIASIHNTNKKQLDIAKKGQKVSIKIKGRNLEEQQKMYGRHFEIDDELVSHISRNSIDVLKVYYKDDLSKEDWKLISKLKKIFKIQN